MLWGTCTLPAYSTLLTVSLCDTQHSKHSDVGDSGWGHLRVGGGAAAIPVVPEALERESVCQNVLQLQCERVLCGKSVSFVHALLTSFKFVTMRAVN